jgi:hypothetical protein
MKLILLILAALLLAVPGMAEMNFTERAYYQGIQEGYTIGALAIQGQSDPAKEREYNDLIAGLNAWLISVGYTDAKWANLQKNEYQLPPIFADYQKPIIIANATAAGIEHKVDGGTKGGASYTTNDMNLLPDPGNMSQIKREGGDYLGGV